VTEGRETAKEFHGVITPGDTAVLWDMDGVLIDSEPFYNIEIGAMIRRLGFPFGEVEIAKVTGISYRQCSKALGLSIPDSVMVPLYCKALMDGVAKIDSAIPGVKSLISKLSKNGVKQALGSSSSKEVVDYVIEKFGFTGLFDVVVTGSDVTDGKPAPDIFLECARRLNVNPPDCLVVEDSINGITAGKAAGMTVCAFSGTNHHGFDLSKADFVIDTYDDKLLDRFVRHRE